MTESNLHHQIQQITAIRNLIRETSAEEHELNERVQSNQQSSQQKRERDLATNQEDHASRSSDALQKKNAIHQSVEKRRTLEPKILTEKHEQRTFEIHSEAEDISEQLEAKLNEATWLTESLYEGAIIKPREVALTSQNILIEIEEKLDALCEEAPKILSRLRQTDLQGESKESTAVEKSMEAYVTGAIEALLAIQSDPKARWFVGIRPILIVLLVTASTTAAVGVFINWKISLPLIGIPLAAMFVAIALLRITFVSGRNSVQHKLEQYSNCVALARRAHALSMESIEGKRRAQELKITISRDKDITVAEEKYKPKIDEVDRLLNNDLDKEQERFNTVAQRLTAKLDQKSSDANTEFDDAIAKGDQDEKATRKQIETTFRETTESIDRDEQETKARLVARWNTELTAFYTFVEGQRAAISLDHPEWKTNWSKWKPRSISSRYVPVGSFRIDLTSVGGALPIANNLQLMGDQIISLPLCATLSHDASVLISSTGKHRQKSIAIVQHTMLRILTATAPGKVKFTLIDPVGLGQSFAGVLHLADYEESKLLDRAWTEPRHIETQLARLTEHMETVIQKYLRNEFESIDAYNEQAGEIAEPYRFLVIADLPNNFSENAAKRLSSIITSGARCGVHVLIHRDSSLPLPAGIDEDTLRRIPLRIIEKDDHFCIDEDALRDLPLTLDDPADEATTTIIVKTIGTVAEDTHRVEVPFEVIAPKEDEIWSLSTIEKLSVPLGKSGATKLQNFTLGRGTAQHALIAGKTGSGKSTLLHVLITNLALWYSPDEVEFYLVEFKKGVEFKTYVTHKLPHARVIAVESDREFGISVLQKVDSELKRRGELFREQGVQDIAGFRKKCKDPMPRILLIVDEFQEFFIDDDRIAQEANLLLDRLVRQGRAFGIHAIMGSQTLDGAYTIGRSTMGQMAVRVALQCSEADSYIILNEDNAAARLLSRPGEAIYNDAAGKVEGNSPFQIVWLDEKQREYHLGLIADRAGKNNRTMVVYEGNKPVHLHENKIFQQSSRQAKPVAVEAWLGGAMAIKDDTCATFRIASANNLLIVGQQEETTTGMVASAMLSLDRQFEETSASFILLDGTPADSSHATVMKEVSTCMGCTTTMVGVCGVENAMRKLDEQLQVRMADGATDLPTVFLVINALHRFRDLRRNEDDYGFSLGDDDKPKTPSQILAELIKEGPPLGMHVIIATDTLSNLNRAFDRQGIREFDMRVLLQMGGNDSTNLIDTPDASKLGMHRALLYSEETGTMEPFRPYALPDLKAIAAVPAGGKTGK